MSPATDDEPPRPDETLDDGDVAPPVDAAARAWVVEQRFVHGLLRTLHTADAESREARIDAVLARLPRRGARVIPMPMLAAAAALLIVAFGIWFWPRGAALPRAEAMVALALDRIDEPVDRRFELTFEQQGGEMAEQLRSHYEFTLRPGNRFRIVGQSTLFGRFEFGCDGETLWAHAGTNVRLSKPLSEQQEFEQMLGMLLEVGFLDLHGVLATLPVEFALHTVGREPPREVGGPARVRLVAERTAAQAQQKLQRVELLLDEPDGLVDWMQLESEPRPGVRRIFRFRYVGVVEDGEALYRRPW